MLSHGMTHTIRDKLKLMARVRRIRGQVEAIERALDGEAGCEKVMHLISAARGAMSGLMAEVVEEHVRTHLVDAKPSSGRVERRSGGPARRRRPNLSQVRAAMSEAESAAYKSFHSHVFLGEGHEGSERRTWAVIWLCAAMMLLEIVGGSLFGSIALIADGLHMSTHAGALLLAALAYTFARRYANDPRFTFGTGKLGDLAGFTSAVILAMIALLIGYEAVSRLFAPVPIHFREAIPIAFLGLAVNVASAWLLSGGAHPGHSHGHAHGHDHASTHAGHDESKRIVTRDGAVVLDVFEDGVPPRFRLRAESGPALIASAAFGRDRATGRRAPSLCV